MSFYTSTKSILKTTCFLRMLIFETLKYYIAISQWCISDKNRSRCDGQQKISESFSPSHFVCHLRRDQVSKGKPHPLKHLPEINITMVTNVRQSNNPKELHPQYSKIHILVPTSGKWSVNHRKCPLLPSLSLQRKYF